MDSLTLSEPLLNNILDYMEARGLSYNTRKVYGNTLRWIWNNFNVLSDHNNRVLLKKFTHANQRAVLHLINNYCYLENIDYRIKVPPLIRQKKKKTIKTLTSNEINIIISAAPKPYDLMLKCIFKIGGGLRISEAIKLSWNHFFWSDWLEKKALGSVLIKDSKGDDRIVPLPKSLMEELYAYAKEQNLLNEFGIPIGSVVFGSIGNFKPQLRADDLETWKAKYVRYAYDWFRYNILDKHCAKALGKKVRVHSLRHSRATQLSDMGKPIEIIQKLLGHKDISTTMIYTEVSNKRVFEAMKDVD